LIFAVVLLLAIIFIFASFSEVEQIVTTLQAGKIHFFLLAVLVEFVWLLVVAYTYQRTYAIVGIREDLPHLFLIFNSAFFINIVTPATGGMPALALFVTDGHRRGHSAGKVMAAWAITLFLDYVGLLITTTLGMAILVRRNNLHWSEITAFSILLAIAAGLGVLLYLGMESPTILGKVLAWLAKRINSVARIFIRRDYLTVERAYTFADDASEGMSALRKDYRPCLTPLLLLLLNKGLMMLILALVFLAFQVPFTAGTIIAGFSIGYLFLIVSPTPQGIGIVEGVLTLTLRSLGVSLEAATVLSLAYRAITFWLPFGAGLITFRRVSTYHN